MSIHMNLKKGKLYSLTFFFNPENDLLNLFDLSLTISFKFL